jgi:hypothetical protein
MSNVTNYLGPEEINAYQTRANQVDTSFQRGLGRLAYQRGRAAQDFGIGNTRLTRSWDKAQKGLASPYARRNVLRSGIYNQGYKDYALNRTNAFSDYGMEYSRQQDAFKQQQDDLEGNRTMALTQIENERSARQAALAADLRSRQ